MAVLLSAFLLHGLVPGPEMLTKHLDVTFSMIWSLTLAHVIGGFICLGFSGAFARLAVVPAGQLVPIVLCIMFVSAYQGSASWGDIYSAAIFGIIGWLMKIYGWPRPPLMLGFVLGSLFAPNTPPTSAAMYPAPSARRRELQTASARAKDQVHLAW